MLTPPERREELYGKLDVFKETKKKHQFRKDKWVRWKKSQALLKKSKHIDYKAWQYWEPDTDTEDEGEPIVPRDNPEFRAMEMDMKDRRKKQCEKTLTAERCKERGNQALKDGDFLAAIEAYTEGLEYRKDMKALWTNKALAETKMFRWDDAIASASRPIEIAEIFEEGFKRHPELNFKAFVRRAVALRALQRWPEALADLEDALSLFPKDKEARQLYEKTKIADEEARKARQTFEGQEPQQHEQQQQQVQASSTHRSDQHKAPQPAAVSGPVRVEIEESDDEDVEDAARAAHDSSLAGLSGTEFNRLLKRLQQSSAERVKFCTRLGGNSDFTLDKENRGKLKQIQEVAEPSALDGLLKDLERCSVLWKKHQGLVVPLRGDVQRVARKDGTISAAQLAEEREERESIAFFKVTTPRAISLLHAITSQSDLHCELTAGAVRHVWPLISNDEWRHDVLELLEEWSRLPLGAKALAEFVGRYPRPHLLSLIQAVTEETKANVLPPNFEDCAREAAERLESGEKGIDAAIEDILLGLTKPSAAEMAISTLGNICVGGQKNNDFKEQLSPFCQQVSDALARRLKPMDFRHCGRAAGALCNVLQLGGNFAVTVQERCLEPLVLALREIVTASPGRGMESQKMFAQAFKGGSHLPQGADATDRLLGALVNLLLVKPASAQQVLALGVMDIVIPLLDGGKETRDDDTKKLISTRAGQIVGRLLNSNPACLSLSLEADLLRWIQRTLRQQEFDSAALAVALDVEEAEKERMTTLDLAIRFITCLLSKSPGVLGRLVDDSPRIEELPDGVDTLPERPSPAISLSDLVQRLLEIVRALRPPQYVGPDDEGNASSRIRGNLSLLFTAVCEAQSREGAAAALTRIDLTPLVDVFVECLRKERGAVQHNAGVCVTRLAQQDRYKKRVRDLGGFESLHQIQLPKVEAQKEISSKLHRQRGPTVEALKGLDTAEALKGLD